MSFIEVLDLKHMKKTYVNINNINCIYTNFNKFNNGTMIEFTNNELIHTYENITDLIKRIKETKIEETIM